MLSVVTLLVIALSSLVVTRIATVALTLTGLSVEAARFQARSALTTAGFTTAESELILSHPVRRRIIMTLMFIGSAGLVSVIATLSSTFVTSGDATSLGARIGTLIVGMFIVYRLAGSRLFDRMLQPIMKRVLERMTDLLAAYLFDENLSVVFVLQTARLQLRLQLRLQHQNLYHSSGILHLHQ